MEQKINSLIHNLDKRNMKGYFVNSQKELLQLIDELIPKDSTVGCGDSMTLEETGIFTYLRNGNYKFLDRFDMNLSK